MPRKKVSPTFEGIATQAIIGLRNAAQRPSIFGYKPMEHQLKFHSSPARGRSFFGGNRSGKSVGGATESVFWLRGEHPYRTVPSAPTRMRGVASDWPHGLLQIMLPELAKWIPPSLLIKGSWEESYNKTEKILTLDNGSTMDFPTHEMDLVKHAGTSRHGIWFDEEPPKAIFNENMARLIDTSGEWWLTETPVEGMTWVYDDIYLASRTNPDLFVIEVDMEDNIYLSPTQIEFLMSTFSDDDKEARKHGKFIQIGGLIYKMFNDTNIVPPVGVQSPEFRGMLQNWTFFNCMDAGFNNPTAWLWAATSKDGKVIVYDEHYESGLIVREHAQIVIDRNRQWGVDPVYNVGDPSIANHDPVTGTSIQTEYAIAGVPIVPGNNDVRVGLQVVATALKEHQLFITSNCEKTIWEHGRYRWATWSNKVVGERKNAREEPNKKNDHTCDALRYGMCSRPEHIQKVLQNLDNLKGLAPSLPANGERFDHPSRELISTTTDSTLGSEW